MSYDYLAGGTPAALNNDFHRYLGNYSNFLCRNCSDPYRSNYNCQFHPQYGPYCLVDEKSSPQVVSRACNTSTIKEYRPSQELQLPSALLKFLEDNGFPTTNAANVSNMPDGRFEHTSSRVETISLQFPIAVCVQTTVFYCSLYFRFIH